MYGMPQPNAYAQYGFGGAGYGGFPNGQGGVAGAGASMPQPNPAQTGGGMALGGQGAGDNSMAGQGNQAPGQWGASDPNAFYQQQYWGGMSTPLRLLRDKVNTNVRASALGYYNQQAQPGANGQN